MVSSTDKKCMWKHHKEPVLEQFKAHPSETFCCIKPDRLTPLSPKRLDQTRKRLIYCDDSTAISKHRFVFHITLILSDTGIYNIKCSISRATSSTTVLSTSIVCLNP